MHGHSPSPNTSPQPHELVSQASQKETRLRRRMTRGLFAGLLSVAAAAVVCFAGACEARAAGNKFNIHVAPAEVKAGGEGTAVVEFTPGPNLKWNHEYPARLTVKGNTDNVDLEKLTFRKGDFKASDEKASLQVPLKGKIPGSDVIHAEAKFSVCNDTTCLIETAPVEIPVDVVP